MTKTELIALTGGIGSGKSVVADLLRRMSIPVYDCDSRAKRLMDSSPEIHRRLVAEISPDVVTDGVIDRAGLGEIVFADAGKLAKLNEIVHGAVRNDIVEWVESLSASIAFVETAILYQSGLNQMVSQAWEVVAPEPLRIERVMRRNSMSAEQVRTRISSQNCNPQAPIPTTLTIVNDDVTPLLPQVEALLDSVRLQNS